MRADQEREFTAFVREQGDGLLRFARMLSADRIEAEDTLQVALIRLTKHWSDIQSPVVYVRTTLVNLTKDGARRRHLVPSPVDTTHAEGDAAAPDLADAIAAQARLDEVLGALPPRQRVTVVLRVLDGLSEAETAELLECSLGTVKSNLARGLDKLRVALATAESAEGVPQ